MQATEKRMFANHRNCDSSAWKSVTLLIFLMTLYAFSFKNLNFHTFFTQLFAYMRIFAYLCRELIYVHRGVIFIFYRRSRDSKVK